MVTTMFFKLNKFVFVFLNQDQIFNFLWGKTVLFLLAVTKLPLVEKTRSLFEEEQGIAQSGAKTVWFPMTQYMR